MNTQIRIQRKPQFSRGAFSDLVMAWARDAQTGEPRYIMELGQDRRGSESGCVCPSCLAPLTAVNAAKAEFIRRPHFRHPNGTERQSCSIVAARFALLKEVLADGWLRLPQLHRKVTAVGLSGETYETWVFVPPQKVRVCDADFQDHTRAILTLTDGRRVQVLLTGSATVSSADAIVACLTVNTDDPQAASLSPDELRNRLTLIPDWLCWQSHWEDRTLDVQAREELAVAMFECADAPPPDLDLSTVPEALHRETVLHYLAKDILCEVGMMRTPAIVLEVTKSAGSGVAISRRWTKPEAIYTLTQVKLERRFGRVIPDVVCEARDADGYVLPCLSIEITVTNPIDEERKDRLRRQGNPALELDLSRTGGRLTRAGLRDMLVEEVAFKNWLWNPEAGAALEVLQRQVDEEVRQRQADMAKAVTLRADALAMEPREIGRQYLAALTNYLQHKQALDAGAPGAPREAAEAALIATMQLAEMLEVRGYFGKEGITKSQALQLVARLLSLKHDRGIGFRYATGFEVLNSIWQLKGRNRQEIPLYMGAARHWKIRLTDRQDETVRSWRQAIIDSLRKRESTYLRSAETDPLLLLLFPDLEEVLEKTTSRALQKRFGTGVVERQVDPHFFTGAALERWLAAHPEFARAWEHLRR